MLVLNWPLPINSLAWGVGSISTALIAWRLYINYRHSGNQLTLYMFWFILVLVVGFGMLSFPLLFTRDEAILRPVFLVTDALRFLSLVLLGRIFWFLVLKQRVGLGWLMVPGVAIGTIGWLSGLADATLTVTDQLVIYRYPPLSIWAQNILLVGFSITTGLAFVAQGLKSLRSGALAGFLKSAGLGNGFIIIGGAVVLNNIYNQGAETIATSLGILISSTLLFIGVVVPSLLSWRSG